MRILHVLDHSIPLHSGYTFRTLSILHQQRRLGWETVHLTSPKHTRPYTPSETVDGWQFYRTAPPKGLAARIPVLREAALVEATTKRLMEVASEERPDILHAHSPVLDAIPALRVGKRLGLPVVYEVRAFWEDAAASHGSGREWGSRYRLTRGLETYALKRADAVTTICEGLRSEIVNRGVALETVTVIPIAVDAEGFGGAKPPDSELVAELGFAGKTVLGFIGSFYSYEGLHVLLAAMPELSRARPDIRLLLVGGGPEDTRLKEQAAGLDPKGRVVFTGRVPHERVEKYYDLVDLLVYPRVPIRLTDLVTPIKPLEAMAQEKIVVASDVGGHRELIRDKETGYLFAANDPKDLVATVVSVLDQRGSWPALRTRARDFVVNERNWPLSVARYKEVYEHLA